jgi:outer membrane protein TolC
MKNIILPLLFLLATKAYTQDTLTIDVCYGLAESNYPQVKQKALIAKSRAYSIENAAKGSLPQISIGGQATYQSDVTEVPFQMPGAEIETLSKDQYKIYGEVAQTLYNGGVVRQQKELEDVNANVEEQKLEVELYQIKNRVNELFFGVLLTQEQLAQNALLKKDIEAGLKKAEASIANGAALKSSADVLRAELLRTDQRMIELQSTERAFKDMLGLFIGRSIDDNAIFGKPELVVAPSTIHRMELDLYKIQKQSIDVNRALLSARKRPKVELFVQGGYGRPGLNMLKNDFSSYYLGGIRFSWSISNLYTFKNEKQLLDLRQQSLDIQQETFLFNTGLALQQQNAEIGKLQKLIQADHDIITLRTQIKNTATAQLEYGTITSTDFIREVNAEDQARQNLALHETQLLLASYNHRFTTGN